MDKYIDADKLKTEIERLRSEAEYEKYESFGNHDGFIINEAKEYICMLLTSFIDTLQQEQSEVHYWKPSEEQMEMLAMFANLRCTSRREANILESLYNDLKKLM